MAKMPDGSSIVSYGVGDETMTFLTLAYAITIHKSQGSEYPSVIISAKNIYFGSPKELLYTAITRAKKKCIIFEESGAIRRAASAGFSQRHSFLLRGLPGE